MKRLAEARSWLSKAIVASGRESRTRALDDPDLEPLWADIHEI